MKVHEIINRLKDTRGYIDEQKDEVVSMEGLNENASEDLAELDYFLDGIEEAIKLIQDSK